MTDQSQQPGVPLPFQLSRMATSYWVPRSIHAAAGSLASGLLAGKPTTTRPVAGNSTSRPPAGSLSRPRDSATSGPLAG